MGALRTGGQGSVYKARRGDLITAVKILPTPIHAEDENDKNFRDFQNEVSKLKKVSEEPNPNVVKILSSGITESGSLPFIEMEFIEGPDLEDLLKPPHDTVFTIQEAVKVADQLSNALAHCHKVGVKHGDIKSNNVKLNTRSGHYMLLDFGLAAMSDEQRRTSLRHAGAIEFMAPEQNEGEVLFQSDVYSFGVILYELLTGVVPFPLKGKGESSRNAVMVSHMERPVPDIIELRRTNLPAEWSPVRRESEMLVPGWILVIVRKCLEKLPENRFKNGVDLHDAVLLGKTSPAPAAGNDIGVLQSENEQLKALLKQYQEKPQNALAESKTPMLAAKSAQSSTKKSEAQSGTSSGGKLRTLVTGLGILLAFLVLFGAYLMFNTSGIETNNSGLIELEKKRLRDSIIEAERISAKRIRDSVDGANRQAEYREPVNQAEDTPLEKTTQKQWERRKEQAEKLRELVTKEIEKQEEEVRKQLEKQKGQKDN